MNSFDEKMLVVFSYLFGMLTLVVFLILFGMTYGDYRERFEKEAIAVGHASWIKNTNNEVIFKWNSEK
jgi:hypothetical protein